MSGYLMSRKIQLFFPIFLLILLQGCKNHSLKNLVLNSTQDCPSQPTTILHSGQIKTVDLNQQPVKESGQLNQNSIGYRFQGKAGQTLKYQMAEDICIWVYRPDNQLVNSLTLPMDGYYVLQVASKQGKQTFELEMGLNVNLSSEKSKVYNKVSSSQQSESSSNFFFSASDYPQEVCGDSKPTNPADYPVDFYPVKVPYSPEVLEMVRNDFCRDAFQKRDKVTREKIIQIASFTDQDKAMEFAKMIKTRINETSVGKPTRVYQ